MDKKEYTKKISESLKDRPVYLNEVKLGDVVSSIFSNVMNKLRGGSSTTSTSSQAVRNRASQKGREPLPKPTAKPFNPMQQTLDKASKKSSEFERGVGAGDRAVDQKISSDQQARVPQVRGPQAPVKTSARKSIDDLANSTQRMRTQDSMAAGIKDPVQAAPLGIDKKNRVGATPRNEVEGQLKNTNAPKRYASTTGGQQHSPVSAPKVDNSPTPDNYPAPSAQDTKASASRAALPSNRVSSALSNKPAPSKPATKSQQSKTTKQVKNAVSTKVKRVGNWKNSESAASYSKRMSQTGSRGNR